MTLSIKLKTFAFCFGAVALPSAKTTRDNSTTNTNSNYAYGHHSAMFWIMNYFWSRHLRNASQRERIISMFINSPEFSQWLAGETDTIKFPVYDQVGWIYTRQNKDQFNFKEEYLVDAKKYSLWEILFYKDAKVYYTTMIVISIIFGYYFPDTIIKSSALLALDAFL